ncbi:relaxase/mobilization nuclease domain-containing protein [Oculatella sp. LEGE 06141]|uniref:relaxase/mobilization nuclease domain-containing protein n=1 Tax=Oculatella sp. LEGE 06141 TaxID=1828648 RepID=UPI0018808253|nr:relaxase/mobilization nuclease domain-containing protein [Oculatella sp. LEGE 06141]
MSIAKIKSNHSARTTFGSVIRKDGSRVIGGNAAPWIERDQLSQEQLRAVVSNATRKFMVSIDLNYRVKRAVRHVSISFPPGEDLDDQELSDYCEKYLAAMILSAENPELLRAFDPSTFRVAVEEFRANELHYYIYSIVRHTDKPHPHAHLVYSRINLETEKAIGTSFEWYRSQQILRDLERQYQLEVLPNSWEVGRRAQSISQLKKEAETGVISIQKQLQEILEQAGQASSTVPEFIEKAQAQGVSVRLNFTRTGKSKGISYELDGVALSGNSLGTRYSFKHSNPGLCNAFGLDYDAQRDNTVIQALCQRRPLHP